MALDAFNSFGLWLTWTTLGRELKALDSMNNSRLMMTWNTIGHEFNALNFMIIIMDDIND